MYVRTRVARCQVVLARNGRFKFRSAALHYFNIAPEQAVVSFIRDRDQL
jgi:hypothetical protein